MLSGQTQSYDFKEVKGTEASDSTIEKPRRQFKFQEGGLVANPQQTPLPDLEPAETLRIAIFAVVSDLW